jgi:hypothetical protein
VSIHFETPAIDSLEAELASLRESRALLEEIWRWYGPYGPEEARSVGSFAKQPSRPVINALQAMSMPDALASKMIAYFDFDDSE